MNRIAIIGGHGKVALLAEPLLVEAGHEVHAIIRNSDHRAEVEKTGANAIVADIQQLSTDDISELLTERNIDTVVWSAGAGGGDPERTYAVDRDAAIRSMDAAQASGAQRYIMVSYNGAGQNHGVPEDNSFYAYAQSKADADDHLRESSLEYTILGPGHLTEDAAGGVTIGHDLSEEQMKTPRATVAAAIVAAVNDATTAGKAIAFGSGDTEVTEAFGTAPDTTSLQ